MRQMIVVTRRHGAASWEVALGPETPFRDQRKYIKDLRRSRSHPLLAEAYLALPVRKIRLDAPKEVRVRVPIKQVKATKPKKAAKPAGKKASLAAKFRG